MMTHISTSPWKIELFGAAPAILMSYEAGEQGDIPDIPYPVPSLAITKRTGLTKEEQETALAKLIELGVMVDSDGYGMYAIDQDRATDLLMERIPDGYEGLMTVNSDD